MTHFWLITAAQIGGGAQPIVGPFLALLGPLTAIFRAFLDELAPATVRFVQEVSGPVQDLGRILSRLFEGLASAEIMERSISVLPDFLQRIADIFGISLPGA